MLRNTEAERLNALYDSLVSQVALKVLVNEPLDDILQFICRQLVALFNLRLVCIGLKEPEGGGVNIRAAAGPGLDCMHETGVPGNNMPAFPLVVHGRVLGTLNICAAGSSFLDEQAIVRISQFAGKVAIMVQAVIDRERLQFLSFHDALTGLYNRAYFDEEIARIDLSRTRSLGVFICDLDGLKLINDTLGHDAGDRLILAAAAVLKKCFRKGDLVARIGGDEFAVILEAPRAVIKTVCDNIYQTVETTNNSQAAMGLPLRMSIGWAVSDEDGRLSSVRELIRQADANMYQEKLRRGDSTRAAILATAVKQLETCDFINDGHAEQIERLAVALAGKVGLAEGRLATLKLLARYHDIGKIAIPESILFKAAPLTANETREVRKHCEVGHRITLATPHLASIADLVLKHHEWWNGEGYPLGLKGENIPLECRILAITDAYDVMTAGRPYRRRRSPAGALAELKHWSGKQFDPDLVEKFVTLIK